MAIAVCVLVAAPLSSRAADENLPPVGRSLFDILTAIQTPEGPRLKVPFPFDDLRSLIKSRAHLSDRHIAETLLPIGRSLQRDAAAPDFFASPRVVLGVTGAPKTFPEAATLMLKDRLYLGYQPRTETLEVISFNEEAGRFEFQIVENYAPGQLPRVVQARRSLCLSCHRGGGPIFSNPPWSETPANPEIAARLAMVGGTPPPTSEAIAANLQTVKGLHQSVGAANRLLHATKYWSEMCKTPSTARYCKSGLLSTVLEHRLSGRRSFGHGGFLGRREIERYLDDFQTFAWPNGFEVVSPFIEDVDPLSPVTHKGLGPATPLSEFLPSRILGVTQSGGTNDVIDLLGDAFTDADIRWLEETLLTVAKSVGAPRQIARVPCGVQPAPAGGAAYWTFTCDGRAPGFPTMTGRITFAEREEPSVTIKRLSIELLDYRDLSTEVMASSSDASGIKKLNLRPFDPITGLRPRTGDGWVIASFDLSIADLSNPGLQAAFTFRDDIKGFRAAAATLPEYRLTSANRPVMEGGFRSQDIMRALTIRLGQPPPVWCCPPAPDLPPATTADLAAGLIVAGLSPSPGPAHPSLQAFHRVCGACHAGKTAQPPNFLFGSSEQQIQAIAECAPRILARLARWKSAAGYSPPMPPPSYLARIGSTAEQWLASTEYRRIQRFTAALGGDQDARSSEDQRELPACVSVK